MSFSVVIHVLNAEPILGEVDELPSPSDNIITVNNPRRKDGKEVNYIEEQVSTVIWPLEKISFIEILPSQESEEEIIGFVREK
jgi:hypothetical protein